MLMLRLATLVMPEDGVCWTRRTREAISQARSRVQKKVERDPCWKEAARFMSK